MLYISEKLTEELYLFAWPRVPTYLCLATEKQWKLKEWLAVLSFDLDKVLCFFYLSMHLAAGKTGEVIYGL